LIPQSVTLIERAAFSDCQRLNGVIIPSSVTYIGKIAFQSNVSMTEITIQNGNTRVAESAFYDSNSFINLKVTIIAPAGGAVQHMASRQKIPFKSIQSR